MDSSESIRNLKQDLAEIEKILGWMEKSNEVHQIDIDILLKKTRNLYTSLLSLETGEPVVLKTAIPAPEPEAEPEFEPVPAPVPVPVPAIVPMPEPEPQPEEEPEMEPEWEPEEETEIETEIEAEPDDDLEEEEEEEDDDDEEDDEEDDDDDEEDEEDIDEDNLEPGWEPYLEPEPIPQPLKQTIQVPPPPPPAFQPQRQSQPSQPSQQPQQPQQPQPSQPPVKQPTSIFADFDLPAPKSQKPPVRENISGGNLFQPDQSLNEMYRKQNPSKDVATPLADMPIADIWSAISINERFLFIRELFGNDPEGFKNTVTLLNSLSSFEAAKKFMTDRFHWDENSTVANDFLNVVRRRFLK